MVRKVWGKKKIPDAGVTPGCQPLSHVLNSGLEQEMDRAAFAATKRHNPDKKKGDNCNNNSSLNYVMLVSSCAANTKWRLTATGRFQVQVQVHVRSRCRSQELLCFFSPSLLGFFLCFRVILSLYGRKPGSSIARTGTGRLQCSGRLSRTKCSFVSQERENFGGDLRALAARNGNDPRASQEQKILKEAKKTKLN